MVVLKIFTFSILVRHPDTSCIIGERSYENRLWLIEYSHYRPRLKSSFRKEKEEA
nr:MAG TPA: hypothetical protein [Caudoviricetes sp.]